MRLTARIPPDSIQAIIQGTIKVPHIEERMPIIFLIDTGCTETTLLQGDVIRLEIPWQDLPFKTEEVTTASGSMRPRLLSNVDVFLPVKRGLFNRKSEEIAIHYYQIDLMSPIQTDTQNPSLSEPPVMRYPNYSLLGMDILQYFKKWKWHRDRLIMDGPDLSAEL